VPPPYSIKPRRPERLAALAVVALLENGEVLEVALHAGDEVLVALPAHHSQLALPAGTPAADAALEPQTGREPWPFRADEDEEGADE
jgi:hypothetical protein